MNVSESNSLTFPVKLKRIVDAPETDHLIYWDEDGLSFHIVDENQLARDVIPNYFKHNNISSFIRQLNMYGFHKMNRIENGLAVISSGKDDSQWSHPNFIRDRPELLPNIARKVTNTPLFNSIISKKPQLTNENEIIAYESIKNDIAQMAKVVQHLKQRDEETSEKLKSLQDENNQLFSALMYLRKEHDRQSNIISMLLRFFSVYTKQSSETRLKAKRYLAIDLPDSQLTQLNEMEPPKKYFVSNENSPNISLQSDDKNSFKGKKVIKVCTVNPTAQVDNKPSIRISNNSLINNRPIQKPQQFITISLPKYPNNLPTVNRAITVSSNNNNKITQIIPKPKINQQNFSQNNIQIKPVVDVNKIAKTVTVSSVDSNHENNVNNQFLEFTDPSDHSDPIFDNDLLKDTELFTIDNFVDPQMISENETTDSSKLQDANVTNIISDISANVNSVSQDLNMLKKCLTTDTYSNTKNAQSNDSSNFDFIYDQNNCLPVTNSDEYKEFKLLFENWENDFQASDPSQIQGHELIPFNNNQRTDWHDSVYNYQDTFSIDDLLQTPDIRPEENQSLNDLKESFYPSDDIFSDSLKRS